jgi:hypothetical protein
MRTDQIVIGIRKFLLHVDAQPHARTWKKALTGREEDSLAVIQRMKKQTENSEISPPSA